MILTELRHLELREGDIIRCAYNVAGFTAELVEGGRIVRAIAEIGKKIHPEFHTLLNVYRSDLCIETSGGTYYGIGTNTMLYDVERPDPGRIVNKEDLKPGQVIIGHMTGEGRQVMGQEGTELVVYHEWHTPDGYEIKGWDPIAKLGRCLPWDQYIVKE